jgi:non-ribosomal peptide synthetase-like protein
MLRTHLPPYMVPAYFEELAAIPMTGSNKADRKSLPPPTSPRFAAGGSCYVAPRDEMEEVLARALAEVMKVDRVSVDDNFFQDLGAHSLLMARFCAVIRRNETASNISLRDIYLNPTIGKLAKQLRVGAEAGGFVEERRLPLRIPTDLEYYGCGALQLAFYLGYGAFALWLLVVGFFWCYAAIDSTLDTYLRIVGYTFGMFLLLSAIPIAAKWTLIGRWRPAVFPVWGLRYFRFWLVKLLIQTGPAAALLGSPLGNVYLRLLGARIGANTVLRCRFTPVCTDLISIGDNTILRADSVLLGYKAQANYVHIGPVHVGSDAIVGEGSLLDIDTRMEDGAQLGHASSLQSGQVIAAGKRHHGSPAQETDADFRFVERRNCTLLRRTVYTALQLAAGFLVFIPLPLLALFHLVPYLLTLSGGARFLDAEAGPDYALLATEVLGVSFAAFSGLMTVGLLAVAVLPRMLQVLLRKDVTYVLYGFHYFVSGMISAVTNSWIFCVLFGDSALVVHYLRFIGYRLNQVVQTGSNFGLAQVHDNPFLSSVGSGTMVSDDLAMVNAPMSNSSFVLRDVAIGDNNYLGNCISFPAAAKTGANCLLATKVMVPTEGPIRENVGLLGSPCFEIPRIVDRDMCFKSALSEERRAELVAAKTRYNVASMFGYLACVALLFATNLFGFVVAVLLYPQYGLPSIIVFGWLAAVYTIAFFALMERTSLSFGRLRPQEVSMYDKSFWRHERHWKYSCSPLIYLFKGTPLKNLVTRLLGVRIGAKVFDDGCLFYDKTLLEIGDFATLNESCSFRAHSLEEGVFKADHIRVGSGCTIGCNALVHYGVRIEDNVLVDPDSFVMKGETLDAGTRWCGNPARAVRKAAYKAATSQVAVESAAGAAAAIAPEPALARALVG